MSLKLLLTACTACAINAQTLPTYEIYRTPGRIVVDGKLDERAWKRAASVGDFHFNWWTAGEKEPTIAKLLWDDEYLYVAYDCRDNHISAQVLERNGPVSRDDSVEIFLSPNPSKLRNYYGFEMNAIGTSLNHLHADWYTGPRYFAPEGVRLRTSLPEGRVKQDEPRDRHWILEIAIPLKIFEKDAAHTPPHEGDVWRINLNRAGGKTNAQYSTWSPVSTPKPNFHVPEAFGEVRFVNRRAGKVKQ